MDFFYGALTALGTFITIAAAAWALLRKTKREDKAQNATLKAQDATLTEAERAARVKERRQDERTARDEYRDLYNAVKEELFEARRDHLRCERRMARIEAALLAAKIPLPPIEESNEEEENREEGQP